MTRVSVLASALVFVAACAVTAPPFESATRRGAVYEPGQSIAESRLCSCRECLETSCCSGDAEAAEHAPPELGMTLAACGHCVRRVWTVRGTATCGATAGAECCSGTVSE